MLCGERAYAVNTRRLELALQPVNVQVDTGSADFAVYTTTTTGSVSGIQVYNVQSSNSSQEVPCTATGLLCAQCAAGQCQYSVSYLDGSGFSAILRQDTVSVRGDNGDNGVELFTTAPAYVGAINNASPNFERAPVGGVSTCTRQCCVAVTTPSCVVTLWYTHPPPQIAGFAYSAISVVRARTRAWVVMERLVMPRFKLSLLFAACSRAVIDEFVAAASVEDVFSMTTPPSGAVEHQQSLGCLRCSCATGCPAAASHNVLQAEFCPLDPRRSMKRKRPSCTRPSFTTHTTS